MVLGGGYQESVSFSRNEVIIIQIRWQQDVKKLRSDEKWMVVVEGKGGTFRIYIIWISIYNMQEFILYR